VVRAAALAGVVARQLGRLDVLLERLPGVLARLQLPHELLALAQLALGVGAGHGLEVHLAGLDLLLRLAQLLLRQLGAAVGVLPVHDARAQLGQAEAAEHLAPLGVERGGEDVRAAVAEHRFLRVALAGQVVDVHQVLLVHGGLADQRADLVLGGQHGLVLQRQHAALLVRGQLGRQRGAALGGGLRAGAQLGDAQARVVGEVVLGQRLARAAAQILRVLQAANHRQQALGAQQPRARLAQLLLHDPHEAGAAPDLAAQLEQALQIGRGALALLHEAADAHGQHAVARAGAAAGLPQLGGAGLQRARGLARGAQAGRAGAAQQALAHQGPRGLGQAVGRVAPRGVHVVPDRAVHRAGGRQRTVAQLDERRARAGEAALGHVAQLAVQLHGAAVVEAQRHAPARRAAGPRRVGVVGLRRREAVQHRRKELAQRRLARLVVTVHDQQRMAGQALGAVALELSEGIDLELVDPHGRTSFSSASAAECSMSLSRART
jgi:hypothetical protein